MVPIERHTSFFYICFTFKCFHRFPSMLFSSLGAQKKVQNLFLFLYFLVPFSVTSRVIFSFRGQISNSAGIYLRLLFLQCNTPRYFSFFMSSVSGCILLEENTREWKKKKKKQQWVYESTQTCVINYSVYVSK